VVANLGIALAGTGVGSTGFVALHLSVLIASDVIMAAYFVRHAKQFGIGSGIAIGLWVGVLNGVFAVLGVLL
jgi:hypothetical protein